MKQLIRTLVVDDSPVAMMTICLIVEKSAGLELVGTASNGREALERVQTLKPDLILMDVVMPEIGGMEATVHLRQRFPKVRVIIVSDYDDKEVRGACLDLGAYGFISKAKLAQELDAEITRLFGAPG